jgi:hypothetical protein
MALAVASVVSIRTYAVAGDVYQPLGVPLAPGCNAGYSWQKIGVRYQCVTPQPTCQYGFVAAPVWNGSAWSYSCNAPPYQPDNPIVPVNPPTGNPCQSYATPGYTPNRAYQWVDATASPGGNVNWPLARKTYGVPANAEPYWAEYDLSKGYSIYWSGPAYPTCLGSQSYYTAICWVDPDSNSVIQMAFIATNSIPQNGCGSQH